MGPPPESIILFYFLFFSELLKLSEFLAESRHESGVNGYNYVAQ